MFLAAFTLAAGLMACADGGSLPEDPAAAAAPPAPTVFETPEGFGDPYRIPEDARLDLPAPIPHLRGDTLVVPLQYGGGCADHSFRLGARVAADTSRLWLRHEAGGERCEALLHDEVRTLVPAEALARVVLFLDPAGGPAYVLRRR